jgi:cytochrome c5
MTTRLRSCAPIALALLALAGAFGCAPAANPPAAPAPPPASAAPPSPAAATPPAPAAAPATGDAAAAALPDGRGKQILLASCTTCHDLREVTKFRGFYTRAQWRDIVVTMVEYGAEVGKQDVEVLADYLDEHLGKGATASQP